MSVVGDRAAGGAAGGLWGTVVQRAVPLQLPMPPVQTLLPGGPHAFQPSHTDHVHASSTHSTMAAYSAYRHVELDKIGFGKRRVLKPPGGGTSDLFASPPDQADSPRKVRAPAMTPPMGDTSPIAEVDAPVYKPGNDSHSRLFGPPDPPRVRRQVEANNVLALDESDAKAKEVDAPVNGAVQTAVVTEHTQTNGQVLETAEDSSASRMIRNCVTGDGCTPTKGNPRSNRHQGGNPVTGEGYESPKSNGSSNQLNGTAAANLRNRVPPGGFSSGLW